MRHKYRIILLAVVLAGSISTAIAQEGGPRETAKRSQVMPAQASPDTPPQHQVIGPPNAGQLPARGELPGASPGTYPSTLSMANAARDAHWWLDRGLALTDEQKRTIYRTLARDGAQAGAGVRIFAEPSAVVPPDARLHEIPRDLAGQIPYIGDFKYVVEQNKVVLVDPVNSDVAAVIQE
jgi:hypothetical protein